MKYSPGISPSANIRTPYAMQASFPTKFRLYKQQWASSPLLLDPEFRPAPGRSNVANWIKKNKCLPRISPSANIRTPGRWKASFPTALAANADWIL